MSLFFLNIKKTFLNQTKNDFDLIKGEKAHYKDKSFCFESEDSKKNCFISDDNLKNFDFFVSTRKRYYLKEWQRNNFSIPYLGIKKEDFPPKETYKYIKEYYSINKDEIFNIDENEWINNWEKLLKKIKYRTLKEEIFTQFWLRKIYDSFKDKSELIKEYEKVFEVHSLSECIRKNMKYQMFAKTNNEFDIIVKDFKDLKIFRNKIDCSNISQGSLGTCYFLEALSILSNHGQLLYQLFPIEEINEEGIYEICLYHQEEWCKILIDDYFVFYKREDENSPLEFYFTQPAKECLYSCFLEKAYAKINGSYCDINGGHPTMALTALTGFDSLCFLQKRINKELIKQMKVFMK